ncbi:bifunctional RNase H/acid phosphatase [Nocardioides sp. R-C-SC26]|uniref:bifunctional RNase H/acid phosphatase n=1 Tax=Nocardioides sp. R-C-SC26 TaxID=2870414 RepID=UPI001E36D531|nr:bifunctional RNase H/acid phosphatase [Nocardioides sp. R-C-SC26]
MSEPTSDPVAGPTGGPVIDAVVIEADGGSRGNPGPAGYGAVLKDAATGAVLAEEGTTIGRATNNVAEYSGLIAGLRLAAEFAPEADIEVRMDSKLVVEQMSGRWKIKHPDMRPLAAEAHRLAPFGTVYTWIPRAQNSHADRLANEALDGKRSGVSVPASTQGALLGVEPEPADSLIEEIQEPATPASSVQQQTRGWSGAGATTTLVVVRHGVTVHTSAKRFSGGLGGDNPPLSDEGRDQIRAVGSWLAPLADSIDVVVASPVRRTRESADLIAEALGVEVVEEPGFAEMEFGHWDGLTFGEVAEQHGEELTAWLGSLDAAPSGGESFRQVQERVMAGLERLLATHAGRTVVVVSHVTPIKTLVADAVTAPLDAVFRMELQPASVTVLSYFESSPTGRPGPRASMRLFNALPPSRDPFAGGLS